MLRFNTIMNKLVIAISIVLTSLLVQAENTLLRRTLRHVVATPENGKVKVAFFDADSTLRIARSGSVTAKNADDVIILPEVSEKIKDLNRKGFFVAIVSNQGGIPKYTTLENADSALLRTAQDIESKGAVINYFDFAETYNNFRKPDVGMAQELLRVLEHAMGASVQLDVENSIMVGDAAYKPGDQRPDGLAAIDLSNSDRLFAENLGVKFIEASDFFGWKAYGIRRMDSTMDIEKYLTAKQKATTGKPDYFTCRKLN